MITGSDLFADLRQAAQAAQNASVAARGDTVALDNQLSQIVAKRGETLLILAQHYLPEINRESVERTFVGIRDELRGIVARKEQALQQLLERIEQSEKSRQALEQQVAEITARLNAKVQERDEKQEQVTQALAADPDFQTHSQRALAAEAELKRNEERVEEITREAKSKLPAYDNSVLFRYLVQRNYGNTDYHATGWIRELDRWVARLVRYETARKGYDFLRSTPELMTQEIERRRGEFQAQMAEVESRQTHVADQLGLTGVLDEGRQLGEQRDHFVAQLQAAAELAQQARAEREELGQHQGQYYQEAVGRLRDFLSQTESSVLEARARDTAETADDQLVAEIQQLSLAIEQLKPQAAQLRSNESAAIRQHEGLDSLVHRFQQANFDSSRSRFDQRLNFAELMQDVSPNGDLESVWQAIQRAQRFEPTWVDQQSGNTSSAGGSIQGLLEGAVQVMSHPATQIMLRAMVQAAGTAFEGSAQRSVARRHSDWSGGGMSTGHSHHEAWPTANASPASQTFSFPDSSSSSDQTPTSRPGFTMGDGF